MCYSNADTESSIKITTIIHHNALYNLRFPLNRTLRTHFPACWFTVIRFCSVLFDTSKDAVQKQSSIIRFHDNFTPLCLGFILHPNYTTCGFIGLYVINSSEAHFMANIRARYIHETVYCQFKHTFLMFSSAIHLHHMVFLSARRMTTSESSSEDILHNTVTILNKQQA